MPLVLAIEPDLRQAAIVKRIVREKVLADVAVVDSRDAALEAIRTTVPDVLLISALLSPRDEDELVAHLRTLDNADHLQTHTIPQLASALGQFEPRASRGLLSAFRRRKEPEVAPPGCDPDVFAEEIRSYLQRAADRKRERLEVQGDGDPQDHAWRAAAPAEKEPEAAAEPAVPSTSSWASPFEWKPATNPSSLIAHPESLITNPESLIPHHESLIANPESVSANPEPVSANPEPPVTEAPIKEPLTLMAHLRPQGTVLAPQPLVVAAQVEAMPIALVQEAAPITEVAQIADAAPIRDTAPIKDSGLGIRDKRSGMRDSKLGTLASWARAEGPERDIAKGSDDLRELLTGLAVPPAVVAVGYGRGCRIRRVRVPAARESRDAETVGAVILSKRMLAEHRALREERVLEF